ncbi:MAG TPA: CAP domain-containing protein, partial [Saprospiraceae bacterium]|nr:CAP domain-containing protein [Saprospiraceae bacterium]
MITRYLLLLTLLSGWNTIIAQCLRDATLIDYQDNFIGSQVNLTELNWTGSVMDTICQPGTISSMAYERTLQRINYYRRLVGLPDSIRWDEVMSDKAQQAAVMMLANHDLSHDPPKTWKCWTQDGYDAARKSNLAFGTQS